MASDLTHPHRSLPPGRQWASHCGTRQKARWRKQQAQQALKKARAANGHASSIVGVEPDGALVLEFR